MFGKIRRTVFVTMAFLACGIAAPSIAQANTPRDVEVEQAQEAAVVRVTIQQADGKVLRATKATSWGEHAEFQLAGHDLDLAVTDKHHIDVRYTRDGTKVANRTVEASPRAHVVLHRDADTKITVQIIPIKVQVKQL